MIRSRSSARGAIRLFRHLGTTILVVGAAWPMAALAQDDGRIAVVQQGDVLGGIASRHGVTVDQLRSWNGLDGDLIRPGQELRVDPEAPTAGAAAVTTVHEVARGETLSAIAVRFGVEVSDLLSWNGDLEADRIRAGQRIQIRGGRRRHAYEVMRGDTLASIAVRSGVRVREILDWNPTLRPDRIRAGQSIALLTTLPPDQSRSVGAPYSGRLQDGVAVPPHPAYVIRDPERAYGTGFTVRALTRAFDVLRRADPRAPRVRVHDLSLPGGGPMTDHRSHQSGRDVDLSYYQQRCGGECPMGRISPQELDARRQWALLRQWLEHDQVEAIFVDYRLQEPLYREARRRGASRQQLHRYFQYPRGRSYPLGTIRHFPRHADHLHVRFSCPRGDADCR